MSEEQTVSIALFGGAINLTHDEMNTLVEMRNAPGWTIFRQILKDMDDAMTSALRDMSAGIEDLRYYQGVSGCASRMAEIVEIDVPEWYAQGAEARSSEGSSEDSDE